MPGSSLSEIYFIGAMMFLILVICAGTVYFFVRTYKSEMKEKRERERKKNTEAAARENV